jgi:membrane protease YdiL (CAAX protease family)
VAKCVNQIHGLGAQVNGELRAQFFQSWLIGFLFCLVYERTGSLYPVIALHALNNAIAFGVTVEDASVSLVLGPLMLLACATIPRAQRVSMA